MIRLIRLLLLAVIIIALVIIGFANFAPVSVTLLPDDLTPFTGFNYTTEVPLSFALLIAFAIGLVLGLASEWIREGKYRSEATQNRREKALLAQEVHKLKSETNRHEGKDEILALLDRQKRTP